MLKIVWLRTPNPPFHECWKETYALELPVSLTFQTSNIINISIPFMCAGSSRALVLFMLALWYWHTTNEKKLLLIPLVAPVVFLLWQVKMSAVICARLFLFHCFVLQFPLHFFYNWCYLFIWQVVYVLRSLWKPMTSHLSCTVYFLFCYCNFKWYTVLMQYHFSDPALAQSSRHWKLVLWSLSLKYEQCLYHFDCILYHMLILFAFSTYCGYPYKVCTIAWSTIGTCYFVITLCLELWPSRSYICCSS